MILIHLDEATRDELKFLRHHELPPRVRDCSHSLFRLDGLNVFVHNLDRFEKRVDLLTK